MWSDWISQAKQALVALRGNGATGNDGTTLPALTSQDTIGVLGVIAPGVAHALQVFAAQNTSQGTANAGILVAMRSDQLSDGQLNGALTDAGQSSDPGIVSQALNVSAQFGITSAKYLAAWPNPGAPHIRSLTQGAWAFGDGSQTYEVFVQPSIKTETDLLVFVRQLMADWQRCLDGSAATINVNASDITRPMGDAESQEFWSALDAVASDLDTLQENPPAGNLDTVVGALKSAANATAQFAGKATAEIANEVGQLTGDAVGGLLSGIGITGAVVGAIVIYIFVARA